MWKNDKIKLLNKLAVDLYSRVGDCGKNEKSFHMLIFGAKKSGAGGMGWYVGGWAGGWMDEWMEKQI